MKTKTFGKFFGTFTVLAFALGVGVAIRSVSAGSGDNVFGFAWGGNEVADTNGAAVPNNGAIDGDESGLGWVSFNSTDCDTNGNGTIEASEVTARPACPAGPTANYGVNIPVGVNGDLSGYAWSEHYGWISFNAADLVGCPSGACKAERVGYQIKGWARILSVRDAGANAGGWSGWIQLDPASAGMSATALNVMASPARFEGYSYSDELGWLQFNPAQGGVFHGVIAVSTLQICVDSGSGTFVPLASGDGGTFTLQQMSIGETKTLKAFYDNDTTDCGPVGSDITASVAWNDAVNNPNNAVDVASGVVTAIANGTESFTASSNGQTITGTVTVDPIVPPCSTCNDEKASHCPTEAWTSGCGANCAAGTGTRYCDMNWKEVAPGQ